VTSTTLARDLIGSDSGQSDNNKGRGGFGAGFHLQLYAAAQDDVIVDACGGSGVEEVELRDGLKFESRVRWRASDAN